MPNELNCRLPDAPGLVEREVLVRMCTDLAARLDAGLVLDQAPEMGGFGHKDTIFVLEVEAVSAGSLRLVFQFGPVAAWQAGTQARHDDLRFDVMDARIDDATIGQLTDVLAGLALTPN